MRRSLPVFLALVVSCTPEQVGCEPQSEPAETASPEAPQPDPDPPVTPRTEGDVVEHVLRFDGRANHYFEVESVFPVGAEAESLTLAMAVWTPGSYLVREYARHLEGIRATDLEGTPLLIDKTTKNRWVVRAEEQSLPERVVVRYRVYANELTVRTNFVGADFASLSGAATFLAVAGDGARPHDVALELPEAWRGSWTPLAPAGGAPHRYRATNYDELVDSPIVLGNADVRELDVGEVPHFLVTVDDRGIFDLERATRDLERIVATQHEFWGVVPYPHYRFFQLLTGGYGGLEHRASTVVIGDRWWTRRREDYPNWLGLMSHELFHAWNVKQLRPASLGPFEYESENYVRTLWVVEGVTSYYDDLLVRRAGLTTRKEYLKQLSKTIARVQNSPGRQHQSLSDASFDAWIKYYRPDENFGNARISYYHKGALAAWLLDARIRDASRGERGLDDVMRLAYQRFPRQGAGYSPEEFRALCSEVAETDLDAFFEVSVDGTTELDYAPALEYWGLRFAEAPEPDPEASAWLGATVASESGRHVVGAVVRDGPAWKAGISPGDELIAFGDERIPESLEERLAQLRPNERVEVLLSRRGHLRRLPLAFGATPEASWTLEIDPGASSAQRRAYEAWLGPEREEEEEEEAAIEQQEAEEQTVEEEAPGDAGVSD